VNIRKKSTAALFFIVGITLGAVTAFTLERGKFYMMAAEKPRINLSRVPKLVMAFYHGWYGNPYGPSKQWVHWNHWVMDTSTGRIISYHDPEKFIDGERRDIGSAHYPILGPYDVRSEEVLKTHFSWAKQAGIDVFVFDWFGPPNDYIDKNFEIMLRFSETHDGILLSILYDGYHYRKAPKEEVISELEYIIVKYGRSEKFLKIEGYPVIFIYACEYFPASTWMEIIARLRAKGLKFIFFGDFSPEHYVYARIFNGIYIYTPDGILNSGGETALENHYSRMKDIALRESLILCTTASPGYDDTIIRVPGFKIDRRDGLTYNTTWTLALKFKPHWVLICSWNEWHEGTEIEPSLEYGYKYLNLTSLWSSKFKSQDE
jgi:hypothetical protein